MNPLKYWKPRDFEISSYRYKLSERYNQTYKGSGSDNTGSCIYTYNEVGFRGDSINKKGFKIMSIGCSMTEGVGVNDWETWPAQLTSLIENGVNLNFGTGGRSNDFIARCLLSYYDSIKPDLVLIMYTFPHRKEFYTRNGEIEPFIPGNPWGFMEETEDGKKIQSSLEELQNDNDDLINWHKNHLLIKYFLESKKCNWVWNGSFINHSLEETNRFDGEYKNFIDLGSDNNHPGPLHNKVYSEKLYNFIKNCYPQIFK